MLLSQPFNTYFKKCITGYPKLFWSCLVIVLFSLLYYYNNYLCLLFRIHCYDGFKDPLGWDLAR